MKKNFLFIWLLVKYKFSRMMMYRADFFTAFIGDGLLFLVQWLTFETIYGHIDTIGDWTRGQMIIFVGTFSLINGLNMIIYFFGIVDLPGKIKRGDLDTYLTKPVSPLLRLTFESVDVGSLPLIPMSIAIILYGVKVAGVDVSFCLGAGYAGLVLLMTILWYDMELILRTIPFFVISANGVMAIEGELLMLNFRVPGVFFKGGFKILFYFIVPYGIMSTVPTQLLTRSIPLPDVLGAILIVILFTGFALWFFKLGVRNYKSASS